MSHWGNSFASAAHQLRLVAPDGKEQVLSFAARTDLKIGSSRECDLVLDGPGVAPQHCRIEERKGRLILFDRGSSAGTLVNDRRCSEPTTLREGDRVTIGLHLLEVLPGRAHLGEDAIAEHLDFSAPGWSSGEATREMNFMTLLSQDAAAWEARKRPARLLLRGPRLEHAVKLHRRLPHLLPWIEASAARRRRNQGLRSWLAGLLPGLILGIWVSWPAFVGAPSPQPESSVPPPPELPSANPPATKPAPIPCSVFELEAHTYETLQDVADDFRVHVADLASQNQLDPSAELTSRTLRMCTTKPPLRREFIGRQVRPGETWKSLAQRYQLAEARLRRYNPEIDRELRDDDWIQLWVDPSALPPPRALPEIQVPGGAAAIGRPGEGELWRGVQLQPNQLYEVRCRPHAFGATSAIEALHQAIRQIREDDGYTGTIIIGDLSKKTGGRFADHLSHQSGRDMDIWLPIKGGTYRQSQSPRCMHCGTKWCQVGPDEVDWDATYRLLRALHDTGRVQRIFLDFPPKRRSEARRGPAAEAERLVEHMSNHVHHLHVRFKCSELDKQTGCRD